MVGVLIIRERESIYLLYYVIPCMDLCKTIEQLVCIYLNVCESVLYIYHVFMNCVFPDMDLCNTVEHGCEHQCVSTPGSYYCLCPEGQLLQEDGKSCGSM